MTDKNSSADITAREDYLRDLIEGSLDGDTPVALDAVMSEIMSEIKLYGDMMVGFGSEGKFLPVGHEYAAVVTATGAVVGVGPAEEDQLASVEEDARDWNRDGIATTIMRRPYGGWQDCPRPEVMPIFSAEGARIGSIETDPDGTPKLILEGGA